jgi:hypothetical protein
VKEPNFYIFIYGRDRIYKVANFLRIVGDKWDHLSKKMYPSNYDYFEGLCFEQFVAYFTKARIRRQFIKNGRQIEEIVICLINSGYALVNQSANL